MDPNENKNATIAMKGEAVSVRSIADMVDLEVRITATTTVNLSPSAGVDVRITGPMEMIQKTAIKKP